MSVAELRCKFALPFSSTIDDCSSAEVLSTLLSPSCEIAMVSWRRIGPNKTLTFVLNEHKISKKIHITEITISTVKQKQAVYIWS